MSSRNPAALVVASVRSSNNGDGLAAWLMSRFNAFANAETKLALASDLMELPLPTGPVTEPVIAAMIELPEQYAEPAVQAWSRVVTATPAIVILTPQYNWGYPGQLKNLLDHLYSEWKGKPVVLVTYGGHGGSKCSEQLQGVLGGGLHMNVVGQVGTTLPKEFIRSAERVDTASVPAFLAEYETQVDEAFERLLKTVQEAR
jgi:NAD(P)H-dependent FMN reductase